MSKFIGIEQGHSILHELAKEINVWPGHSLYPHRNTESRLLAAISKNWGEYVSAAYAQRGFEEPKHEELMRRIAQILDEIGQVS